MFVVPVQHPDVLKDKLHNEHFFALELQHEEVALYIFYMCVVIVCVLLVCAILDEACYIFLLILFFGLVSALSEIYLLVYGFHSVFDFV